VTEPLDTPVNLNTVGQFVDAGELSLRMPLGSMT